MQGDSASGPHFLLGDYGFDDVFYLFLFEFCHLIDRTILEPVTLNQFYIRQVVDLGHYHILLKIRHLHFQRLSQLPPSHLRLDK